MPDAAQIHDDLADVVKGEIRGDDLTRALYSTDASIFQRRPLAVVTPRDEADVQALVRYAAEHQLPLTARGAGTGMAGECLGEGLILDFARHFRQVLDVGPDTVRAQVGAVYQDVQARLAPLGRRLAPDPASGNACTVGGAVANNASGARALKYGYVRDHVAAVRAVLANGDVEALGLEPVAPPAEGAGFKQQIVHGLAGLIGRHAELIRACQPRTRFNRCGYLLHDVLTPEGLDLARLLTGTEGTLALFTEVTLRTVPLPADRALVLLRFAGLEEAARAAGRCLAFGPAACELVDRRLLALTCQAHPAYEKVVPAGVQAVLLVEFEDDRPGAAQAAARDLARRTGEFPGLMGSRLAVEPADIDWLWQLRDLALPILYALRGQDQAVPFIEDVAVPVEQLAGFLHRTQEILQRRQITATFLVHAGAAQVHARPFLDLRQKDAASRLRDLADEVYRVVLDLGGTISTQHGVGLARTPWVAAQYGRLAQVFREVKALFDPQNLFNPGKIVDGHSPALGELRQEVAAAPPAWQLRWPGAGVGGQCHACTGCGACRGTEPGLRMCPVFHVDPDESATPRAKANLLRTLLGGGGDPAQLSSDATRAVADLCINCKMCAVECPAHVAIPKLMLEAKAQHAAEHGLGRSDWVLARTEQFAALGSACAWMVNAALDNPAVRWWLEKLLGVARQRKLPRFAQRSFLQEAVRRGWAVPPRRPGALKVAYFVDVYANYNDPLIAEAAVAVLHHNGVEVFVPPGQVGCGMAPLAYGDVDTARHMARRNVRLFADLVRAGYVVLCSEPTAALMLRQDYLDLLDDEDARLVAANTVELTAFLGDLQAKGRLRTDFQPVDCTVGHHVPCHVKALGLGVSGPRLLGLVPQLRPTTIDVSCSGMAGTYGLKADHFELSLAAGRPMLDRLRRDDLLFGSSECSACRMQMEQGAGKRSLHPVQYLALAYGLMPQVAERLREPLGRLVLR